MRNSRKKNRNRRPVWFSKVDLIIQKCLNGCLCWLLPLVTFSYWIPLVRFIKILGGTSARNWRPTISRAGSSRKSISNVDNETLWCGIPVTLCVACSFVLLSTRHLTFSTSILAILLLVPGLTKLSIEKNPIKTWIKPALHFTIVTSRSKNTWFSSLITMKIQLILYSKWHYFPIEIGGQIGQVWPVTERPRRPHISVTAAKGTSLSPAYHRH